MATTITEAASPALRGSVALALLAYTWWGLVPLYWRELPGFSAPELMIFRCLFSALSLAPLTGLLPGGGGALLRSAFPRLLLTSTLIGFNWCLYIWAVTNGHVVDSSLGYFLNPLVNMALGALFLGERMSRSGRLACALASGGVFLLTWQSGTIPWIALLLALSFGFYGFFRKRFALPTASATFCESLLLSGPALLFLLTRSAPLHAPQASTRELLLLALSGPVTTIPLLAFAAAARRLPLTLMGFFQFCSPTLQFLLGVFVFREEFRAGQAAAFGLIWAGLGIFLAGLLKSRSISMT